MRLLGRAALVTGGSRGIGRAIATELAREGADVVIGYAENAAAAAEAVAACQALGRKAMAIPADVSDANAAEGLVRGAVEFLGHLDILVNSAGIAWERGKFVEEADLDLARRVMNVNFFGSFNVTHHALPHLRKAPIGNIFFLSSTATRHQGGGLAPYVASKMAVEGLARSLAHELQPSSPFHGDCAMSPDCPHLPASVRVNVLAPWVADTDMGKPGPGDGAAPTEEMLLARPFGKLAQPKELGELCAFLASQEASYISGQVIYVDGARF